MNLIEKLGYEEAKKQFDELKKHKELYSGEFAKNDAMLLDHRRQHGIFEKGDKVIITQYIWGEPPYPELCYVFNPETHHIVGCSVDISVGFGSSKAYRHATPEEITAGHRID